MTHVMSDQVEFGFCKRSRVCAGDVHGSVGGNNQCDSKQEDVELACNQMKTFFRVKRNYIFNILSTLTHSGNEKCDVTDEGYSA